MKVGEFVEELARELFVIHVTKYFDELNSIESGKLRHRLLNVLAEISVDAAVALKDSLEHWSNGPLVRKEEVQKND